MKFFEQYFDTTDFTGAEEVKVLCPFHSDTHPSASVNTAKGLFHCWVCGVGYTEQQFISKVNGISLVDAGRVLSKLNGPATSNWNIVEKANLWANESILEAVHKLGISDKTIEELRLGCVRDKAAVDRLAIPVFYNGVLMDVRAYDILKKTNIKMLSDDNAEIGYVIPYDLWRTSTGVTYVMEGEKDMMLARELGINAITLTGGAGATPNELTINAFKDRDIILCYDNDDAGREGMRGMYLKLKNVAKSVRYIRIGDVVKENKEDFFDFIKKYNQDAFDFYGLDVYEFGKVTQNYTPIKRALGENTIKKGITSEIVVSGEFDETYAVPTLVKFTKVEESEKSKMFKDEERVWYLETGNISQLLELIELDAKKSQVVGKIQAYLDIPAKEDGLRVEVSDYITVYKSRVADIDDGNTQLDIYAFRKLDVGKQYDITYRIYPHPTKNQKLVVLATEIVDKDTTSGFVPDKQLLREFQKPGTIKERLDHQYQSAKHHIAKHLDYNLWLMSDLVFNSVLEFDYGDRIRGALDVFILGDTQVGKSETTSKLTELYKFGHFLSLKTSTTVGLIGGSNKVDNSWLNTIGAIPRQHGKLVVMEEFSGAKPEFLKTMTEIRSSGWLRLARAAGELKAPCRLRMITLSNAINDEQGNPRHLSTFPNGVAPLMELIKSAEDVSRYDGFLLMPKPMNRFNPFAMQLKGAPIAEEAYQHKIQWVYTRKPEDVVFEDGVESYIWDKAEVLNNLFECNFPLFTTTTSLKLARFSVALSALLVSTDSEFNKIIVTKEIVDYITDYLISIYDNPVFKLREYKKEYDSYNTIADTEIPTIQDLYSRNSTMFDFIDSISSTSRANLRTLSGMDGDSFNPVFNAMVSNRLIRLSGDTVIPTPRFRAAMRKIDKTIKHDTGKTMVERVDDKWKID